MRRRSLPRLPWAGIAGITSATRWRSLPLIRTAPANSETASVAKGRLKYGYVFWQMVQKPLVSLVAIPVQ